MKGLKLILKIKFLDIERAVQQTVSLSKTFDLEFHLAVNDFKIVENHGKKVPSSPVVGTNGATTVH